MVEIWDTSALIVAARETAAASVLAEALVDDAVGVTEPILLEYLNGARQVDEYDRFETRLRAARLFETTPEDWRRALEVHRRLAGLGAGHQRSVRIVDLIIAAVAERNGCPVVHVDEDYDRIASITGQSTRRLAIPP
ncbi:MAG: PIN domain-containing protein, partial [Chloroflexota bacterium]